MNQVKDIDDMDNSGSDVVDVLDELEMPEGGDDAVDLDEVDGDHFDIEEGIDSDSSFLCDHLSARCRRDISPMCKSPIRTGFDPLDVSCSL